MRTLLAFATIGLFCGSVALAAGNPAPSMDAAQLAAFMEKWQKFQPLESFPEATADWPFLLAALASWLPAISAAQQDPATVLREE